MPRARDAAILAAYRAGQSLRQIARDIGTGPTLVWRALDRHGEPRRPSGQPIAPPTPAGLARDAAVLAAYRAGQSLDAVSRSLSVGKTTAWSVLVRHSEPRRSRRLAAATPAVPQGSVTGALPPPAVAPPAPLLVPALPHATPPALLPGAPRF